ncbi:MULTISPECIES: rhamnan synthesis F family protein [Rhodobacterales]|uniref:rhamnan synthesis F family protein n=1 Tax=Rhodobacterales TaxID=204455 RepID=UPI0015F01A6B|nr:MULTISPECIES: rhamnan synthesis F family protein [Rhodobacterales]MDO6591646.1 rhamnan synthesis F family protein [Yoonia sp. 1_MG-2023]
MKSRGYNVVMVANGGLQDSARKNAVANVWRLLERPNFGYDFGGFRDAIHFLQQQKISPKNLVLMNDSVWFPMWSGSKVIERLEDSDLDVTGLLFHVPTRNEYPDTKYRVNHVRMRAEHIESYVTMVPVSTYKHPAFQRFWDSYEQTDSKLLTIKRGEVGFSRAMDEAGLTVGALSRRKSFLHEVCKRSDQFIEQTLRYAAYSDQFFADECSALLASPRDETWRDRALAHIGCVIKTRRFNASFCWATEQIFQTSFVKKNTDRLFQVGRIRFLEAVENGDIQCDNLEALEELKRIAEADREHLPQKAWRQH